MPDFDVRRKAPASRGKKRKKKKQSIFMGIVTGLLPWKGDSVGDVIRKIIFLLSIALLVYACFTLIYFYVFRDMQTNAELAEWTALKEQSSSNDLITISIRDEDDTGDSGDGQREVQILEEYSSFYERNNDFVGWIAIPPYINYPIAQSDDNQYYLEHNFDKVPTANGTIFADYRCCIEAGKMTNNIILYGHNLITNNYFQPLANYKKLDFLIDNPTIEFDTLYEKNTYKIFSMFMINTSEEHGEVWDYQNTLTFTDKATFDNYVAEALDRTLFFTGVDLQYGDEILTLSTCDFGYKDGRFVVMARKVRKNESPLVEESGFVDNSGRTGSVLHRKMFDAYYQTYGLEWGGRNWDRNYIKDFEG